MTSLTTMYDAIANSVGTTLAEGISDSDTEFDVADGTKISVSPGPYTIGATSASAETVLVSNVSTNTLTVTRGWNGTSARAWDSGTDIQRCFTAYDHDTFIDNLEALNTGKQEIVGGATENNFASFDDAGQVKDSGSAAADYVTKAIYDANTILAANSDNTPAALTVAEQTLVGRITSGNIDDLSISQVKTLLGAGAASGLATLTSDTIINGQESYSKIVAASTKTLAASDNGTSQYNASGAILLDPATDVTLNGGTDTITLGTTSTDYTYTIPKNTTVALPIGFEMDFITADGDAVFLKKVATDTWIAKGDV